MRIAIRHFKVSLISCDDLYGCFAVMTARNIKNPRPAAYFTIFDQLALTLRVDVQRDCLPAPRALNGRGVLHAALLSKGR